MKNIPAHATSVLNKATGEFETVIHIPWKTPWNHDTDAESLRTSTKCTDPSLTKQEFKDETDINVILERFKATKQAPPMAMPENFGMQMTHEEMIDARFAIAEADGIFYRLDPAIRSAHANSPMIWHEKVLAAFERDDRKGLRELGLDAPDRRPPETPEPPTPTGGYSSPRSGGRGQEGG